MQVDLKRVSKDDWFECTKLDVTDEQKQYFPCPVVYWLAESAFLPHFTPLAIYDGEKLVGFLVYGLDPDDDHYWLISFMIDRRFQGQGYGKRAMTEFVQYMKHVHDCTQFKLGHRLENKIAESLYTSMGFEQVGSDGHEVIRRLVVE